MELGKDAAAHFHQLVVERGVAVELDSSVTVDALDLRLFLGFVFLGKGERFGERDPHLTAADFCFLLAVVHFRPDRPREEGRRAVKVHFAQPANVEGGRPLRLVAIGLRFHGELHLSRAIDVGRVGRAVKDNAVAFNVRAAVADVGRLAVDDHFLV